jgi:hypothetical protein
MRYSGYQNSFNHLEENPEVLSRLSRRAAVKKISIRLTHRIKGNGSNQELLLRTKSSARKIKEIPADTLSTKIIRKIEWTTIVILAVESKNPG